MAIDVLPAATAHTTLKFQAGYIATGVARLASRFSQPFRFATCGFQRPENRAA